MDIPAGAHAGALRRAAWLKRLYRWHWISAAVSLVGLLSFAFTGFTLNHAADIEARPRVQTHEAMLPESLHERLADVAPGEAPLPDALVRWLAAEVAIDVAGRPAEWSADEVYLSLPRPGGDAWLRIDRESGELEYERTDRGWIAWLNDLHKGRHAGAAWSLFIDVFAIACLAFAATGLAILAMHAPRRPLAWPLVALGAVLPAILLLLFVH
ncbi:MAG TPA: PepSY-associated TM helix domain-containing protein [Burkholderiaceae bacterium]|nr:PepSY-associated TM helix domain-containing protein [Burkholderiaceae bacterium]